MVDCDIHSWSDLYRQVSWNKTTMMWPVYSTFPLAFSLSLSLSLHTSSNNTCNTFCMHFYHQCPVPGWHHQWHHSRLTWLGSKEVRGGAAAFASVPDLNEFGSIIAPKASSACCASIPQLSVSYSRWCRIECKPCSARLWSWAECGSHPSRDGRV